MTAVKNRFNLKSEKRAWDSPGAFSFSWAWYAKMDFGITGLTSDGKALS
jgi:hypothetical protein